MLTDQADPPRNDPNPDDAALGAASDTESEQSSETDGDHVLTRVNPPGGVAPQPLRHEEPSTKYKPRLGRPAQGSGSQKETYILFQY